MELSVEERQNKRKRHDPTEIYSNWKIAIDNLYITYYNVSVSWKSEELQHTSDRLKGACAGSKVIGWEAQEINFIKILYYVLYKNKEKELKIWKDTN